MVRCAFMNKSGRVIAYTIAAFLVVTIGGVVFAVHILAHAGQVPAITRPQEATATAPLTTPPAPVAPTSTATTSASEPFSGLVTSIWDDRIIIESPPSLPTGAVTPHTIIVTPDTRITSGAWTDITIGTAISGSGTPDATGAIMADSLAITSAPQ